jgi:head-tail adaptor
VPRAGELDRFVIIEQDTGATRDTDGAPLDGWTKFVDWWAKKESLEGSEGETGEGRVATVRYQWSGHYITGVKPTKMRINEDGVLHDIVVVDDTKKRRGELVVITKQRGA